MAVEKREPITPVGNGKSRGQLSFFDMVKDAFFTSNPKSILEYAFKDILIPAAKDALYNMITGSASISLYGTEARRPSTGMRSQSGVPWRDYTKCSTTTSRRDEQRPRETRSRNELPNEAVFDTREDALEVKRTLIDRFERYGVVSVQEFCIACGLVTTFADCNYGWEKEDLTQNDIHITPYRGGYLLSLPRPNPIE